MSEPRYVLLADLRSVIEEYGPACECDFPPDKEDGIIVCFACEIRELADWPSKEHVRREKKR